MFSIGIHAISPYGSGIFVSLASPLLIVSTTYYAYKKGLEQLARFMQVGGTRGGDVIGTDGWWLWAEARGLWGSIYMQSILLL